MELDDDIRLLRDAVTSKRRTSYKWSRSASCNWCSSSYSFSSWAKKTMVNLIRSIHMTEHWFWQAVNCSAAPKSFTISCFQLLQESRQRTFKHVTLWQFVSTEWRSKNPGKEEYTDIGPREDVRLWTFCLRYSRKCGCREVNSTNFYRLEIINTPL